MVSIKALGAALMALALTSGCMSGDIEALRGAAPKGDEFTRTLTGEYLRFVNYEWDEMDDWFDARHFARKGLKTAQGVAVPPEAIADWRLPKDAIPGLERARVRLVGLLAAGARDTSAYHAAIAQARFDCWVEQREENFQPDDIKACRDGFFAAVAAIEGGRAKPSPRAPNTADTAANGADGERRHLLFFAHDSTEIDDAGGAVIRTIAAAAAHDGSRWIVVTGHTDRSGQDPYNAALSLRRADAVRAALVAAGIAGQRITVKARGEGAPLVATADGVREPKNRRAEIDRR